MGKKLIYFKVFLNLKKTRLEEFLLRQFWLCNRLVSFVPMLVFSFYCLNMFFQQLSSVILIDIVVSQVVRSQLRLCI